MYDNNCRFLNPDGSIHMSAALMAGRDVRASAVHSSIVAVDRLTKKEFVLFGPRAGTGSPVQPVR